MQGSNLRRRLALTGLLAVVLAAMPAAGALAAAPGPGCAGVAFTDPSGDAQDPFLGSAAPFPGLESLDLTKAWVRSDGLTASVFLQVANLSGSVPTDAEAAGWYFNYRDLDGNPRFVSASLEAGSSAYTFSYGTYDANLGYQTAGATTGEAFPGADGVLRIDLPDVYPGDVLDDAYAQTQDYIGAPQGLIGVVSEVDAAPDGGSHTAGTGATVTTCESETTV